MCARCNRVLLRPPVLRGGMAFGPRCSAIVSGAMPKRPRTVKAPTADPRQPDLFAERRP